MINKGRYPVLGVMVSAVDYEYSVAQIISAAQDRRPFGVTALAVHGVMTGFDDAAHSRRLNSLDMVTPDGQPVRWALKRLHGVSLPDRVYGPTLISKVLHQAAEEGLSVYFYGSRNSTLQALSMNLSRTLPGLRIAGLESSKFRKVTVSEQRVINQRIIDSGASIVFVGLGCPRQEVWTYENVGALGLPVIAVGAAFDFLAGVLPQAPTYLQDRGLEWAFRLVSEPRRLWKRYLVLSPRFVWYSFLQRVGFKVGEAHSIHGEPPREYYG